MKAKIVIYDSETGHASQTKSCTNEESGHNYFESATTKSSKCKVEKTAKLTTNFRFKLTTHFRSKLTTGFRSKLTT